MSVEYRVVWKREGQQRRRKLFQRETAAREYRDLLAATNPEEDWFGRERPGDDDRFDQEEYDRQHAAFTEEPHIEVRPVGIWGPQGAER